MIRYPQLSVHRSRAFSAGGPRHGVVSCCSRPSTAWVIPGAEGGAASEQRDTFGVWVNWVNEIVYLYLISNIQYLYLYPIALYIYYTYSLYLYLYLATQIWYTCMYILSNIQENQRLQYVPNRFHIRSKHLRVCFIAKGSWPLVQWSWPDGAPETHWSRRGGRAWPWQCWSSFFVTVEFPWVGCWDVWMERITVEKRKMDWTLFLDLVPSTWKFLPSLLAWHTFTLATLINLNLLGCLGGWESVRLRKLVRIWWVIRWSVWTFGRLTALRRWVCTIPIYRREALFSSKSAMAI